MLIQSSIYMYWYNVFFFKRDDITICFALSGSSDVLNWVCLLLICFTTFNCYFQHVEFIDDDGVENSWSVLDQNAFLNHFFIVPNLKTNKKKTNFYIHRFSHAWNCDVRSLKHHLETKKENKDKNSSKHSVTRIVMVIWQVFCYWKRKTGVPSWLLINIRFGSVDAGWLYYWRTI